MPSSPQAEAMIRRVSPEGRARALKERERQRRSTARLAGRIALAALVTAAVATAINLAVMPIGAVGVLIALAIFVAACVAILLTSRERAVPLEHARLDALPGQTERWLESQRPLLPHGSGTLLDSISRRLGEMGPQLAMLDPAAPAADAVRRLLATDLPALVHGYEEVPASLRARLANEGRSADAQLLHGLSVIDEEIDRMTELLARGAFDELATQHRFLELKYEGAGTLG